VPVNWERASSVVFAVSAALIAAMVIKREFTSRTAPEAPGTQRVERVSEWRSIADSAYTLGPKDAAVSIIEFADLECPFCARYHETLRAIREQYPQNVSVSIVHFPLPGHRFAVPAARAVECAAAHDRKTELIDRIYQQQDSMGLKSWAAFARDVGVSDTTPFVTCVRETSQIAAVERGLRDGKKVGVRGTPTVLVNGWKYPMPPSESDLRRFVDSVVAIDRKVSVAR
jgi:protein-disulfide isomerase